MTKPKMSALVASAIRNLREIRGSTSKEIMNYIKSQYSGSSDSSIQKQIYTALKRGLDYGILKRDRGYYSLNLDPDLLYKAPTAPPSEQGRGRGRGRRRRRRRRRGVSRRGRRRRRRRGRGRGRSRGRARGRGRGRRRRRRRRSRGRSRESPPLTTRSLITKCKSCSTKKRTEDTLRKTPMETLREDMTYLYNKDTKNHKLQTPSRHQSRDRSRNRSQTRSRSTSSEKMGDDQS
ncbi:serine/arginine-rich splicing factor 6-like [Pseudomyrmex gracilis]|uniref:serine/arginine-rich splicing factor 6-like n=1 Tax=Pseudomyrmex gracilis TaxID=219809 RepID=UPI000995B89C|nr:serine/arginine-rich splicing factor 6-like [Pseudomyrmex gracilis]